MKRLALTATLISTLSACSVGTPGMSVGLGVGTHVGSHLGLGTSLNIPISLDKNKAGNTPSNTGINIIDEQIVTYFDAHGNTSTHAVKGGYYRQLLNKRGNDYIVQDFYSDNSKKRTDPFLLNRKQLMQFRATPSDGSLTTYAYNGNIMQQQVFQNGKLISAQY